MATPMGALSKALRKRSWLVALCSSTLTPGDAAYDGQYFCLVPLFVAGL